MAMIPSEKWTEFKKELINRWHELTEDDLRSARPESDSVVGLLETKLGMALEEAREKMAEMAAHYHLYEEPEEDSQNLLEEKQEKVLELSPKVPANKDRKPKNDTMN